VDLDAPRLRLGPLSFIGEPGWWVLHQSTHFPFRIDVWDDQGDSVERHVAGVDDLETAVATYWSACRRRWPKAKITLRQEARIIEKRWRWLGGGARLLCRFSQLQILSCASAIASPRVPVTLTADDRASASLALGKWIVTAHSFRPRPVRMTKSMPW
jgi:hypothetical protein